MKNSSNTKQIALWIVVVLVIAGAIFGMAKVASNGDGDASNLPVNVDDATSRDWTKGNTASKIIMVEYSDFQCPACAAYYPLVKQLNEEMSEKMLFVYRHFPLAQHKNAKPAAYAAEAAGKQGKFWEMHNMIFENQQAWSNLSSSEAKEAFAGYAEKLGINMEQYKSDAESDEIEEKVDNDYKSGSKAGVPGTPTFYVNGKKLPSPRSYDEFKQLVEYIGNNS